MYKTLCRNMKKSCNHKLAFQVLWFIVLLKHAQSENIYLEFFSFVFRRLSKLCLQTVYLSNVVFVVELLNNFYAYVILRYCRDCSGTLQEHSKHLYSTSFRLFSQIDLKCSTWHFIILRGNASVDTNSRSREPTTKSHGSGDCGYRAYVEL